MSRGIRQLSSPFNLPLDAGTVAKAQEAVGMGLASGSEVIFFTKGIPVQAVVANLIFHRAGFGTDRMAQAI